MGYCHTWRRPLEIPKDQYRAFMDDFKQLLSELPPLRSGTGRDMPWIGQNVLEFNGDAYQGHDHETFCLDRISDWKSDGVKTNRKPYDTAVCCALIVATKRIQNFKADSDGGIADWKKAADLCEKILGYGSVIAAEITEYHSRTPNIPSGGVY